jgi:hypothetical protein
LLSFRIIAALGPDQLLNGTGTGVPAPAVIVLGDRKRKEMKQKSIRDFFFPKGRGVRQRVR